VYSVERALEFLVSRVVLCVVFSVALSDVALRCVVFTEVHCRRFKNSNEVGTNRASTHGKDFLPVGIALIGAEANNRPVNENDEKRPGQTIAVKRRQTDD
jgi:hypothetical protein